MGGASSQPASSAEPAADETNNGPEIFTLSESLQEQMALEFQNEQVIKMFGKQLEKIGERKTAAYKQALEQKALLERKMNEFREQNTKVQNQLNATIEGLEDKFTDGSNVLEYDIARLEKKYLDPSFHSAKGGSYIPCFVEQTEIASCLRNKSKDEKSKKDPFACDVFVQALADCTDKTITKKA